jgi:hypothetical protein
VVSGEHGVDRAADLHREVDRDERAAAGARLDDHDGVGERGDDPVAQVGKRRIAWL